MPVLGRLGLRASGEDGFTVVEALVATFLLLAGVLSVIGVFDDSRDQNATGERSEIALMQAEQALEEMRGIPYNRLLLNAGAVDPGTGRVLDGGARFRVKPALTEPLVYYTSEGVPSTNAWVTPTSSVSIGTDEAPLELTIHRFITWRDEECEIANLDGLGAGLPDAVNRTKTLVGSLVTLVSNLLNSLLVSSTNKNNLQTLRDRLQNVQQKLGEISGSLDDLSELDLCDLDVTVLQKAQQLGALAPQLGVLNPRIEELNRLLGALVPDNTRIANQITSVNGQLNCMFQGGDTSYFSGLQAGLDAIALDANNTPKNTKRIAVAVLVEPRRGVGPMRPVWASSVVRDPTAGLLSEGGPSCV